MTIGVGLLINLDRTSSWAKIVIYQLIAGIGTYLTLAPKQNAE